MLDYAAYNKYFKKAILIRQSEKQLLALYKQGKITGTIHTCIGQEFTGVAICNYLTQADFVFSNHRGHGHYLAKTGDLNGLFSELLGKKSGCSAGIGGSQHLHHKNNFFSSGIQAGLTPLAAGVALASNLEHSNYITVIFIGDGTLGEGLLYESLNIAGIWNLPLVFVIENNQIAQSTDSRQTTAGSISKRADAFGIDYFLSTTDDIGDLFYTCEKAVNSCRNLRKPVVLEIKTNRLHSHSKGDDNRAKVAIQALYSKDPINQFAIDQPSLYKEILAGADDEIEKLVKEIEKEEEAVLFEDDFYVNNTTVTYHTLPSADLKIRGNDAIYEFLKSAFQDSDKLVMLGEDIENSNSFNPGKYGGAFKVSKDLNERYPNRIKNTPISEAVLIGIGSGLAIRGFKPIIEIMFGDFLTLTFDQIYQHATKFPLMYGKEIHVPLIIRTPMGGYRGYGPTHSQSIEKFFLGISQLTVIALNHRINPANIYAVLLKEQTKPTLVIENKSVYTQFVNQNKLLGFHIEISDEVFPSLRIQPDYDEIDCTILCYGGVLSLVELAICQLFDEDELVCEVICPTCINPINSIPIKASVEKSGYLLVVEEGTKVAAYGSEVIARLIEEKITLKGFKRLSNDTIIPSSIKAEKSVLPQVDSIKKGVYDVLNITSSLL